MIQNIEVGKCYATANNQHRRVVCIDGDKVIYESWGGNKDNHRGQLTRTKVSLGNFRESVDKEIKCPEDMRPLSDVQAEAKCNCSEKVEKSVDK